MCPAPRAPLCSSAAPKNKPHRARQRWSRRAQPCQGLCPWQELPGAPCPKPGLSTALSRAWNTALPREKNPALDGGFGSLPAAALRVSGRAKECQELSLADASSADTPHTAAGDAAPNKRRSIITLFDVMSEGKHPAVLPELQPREIHIWMCK